MADHTKIEWTDATWNPITGCSVHSPGCTNCYAMKLAGTRLAQHPSRAGLTRETKAGPVWTGEVRFNEEWLTQPLKWKRPRRIFVCAHADLFHEAVPDEWIDTIFGIMVMSPQHQFQVLTKRSARMRDYMTRFSVGAHYTDSRIFERFCPLPGGGWDTQQNTTPFSRAAREAVKSMRGAPSFPWVPENVWLGVSVEDQARADERIPDLLATPAAVRWLSCEPLLGPLDLWNLGVPHECKHEDAYTEWDTNALVCSKCEEADYLDWIVAGGESGPGARPMHPDWARSLRDQCQAAGVPFLFKQWGAFLPTGQTGGNGKVWTGTIDGAPTYMRGTKEITGRLLDGVLHDGFPA